MSNDLEDFDIFQLAAYRLIIQKERQEAKESLSPEDKLWIGQQNSTRAGIMKIQSITGVSFNIAFDLYRELRQEYFAEEKND